MKTESCVLNTAQLLAPLLIIMLAACDQPQVRTYRAPKDYKPPPDKLSPPGRTPIAWEKPPDWQPVHPGPMRFATFVVTGPNNQRAEISVVPLSDHAGSDFDNFNRWRAQLGLPPATQEEMKKSTQQIEIGGQQGKLVEIAGVTPDGKPTPRIIVAIVQQNGTTWFFKMIGDDELVSAQKPGFISFLQSIQYAD